MGTVEDAVGTTAEATPATALADALRPQGTPPPVAPDVAATLPSPGSELSATTAGARTARVTDDDSTLAIGRFTLERKLGEGGMGAVYLATDPTLGRRVAIKVLHKDAGADAASARRRLVREAQGTAQLSHEHVVVVHEVGTHDDHVYLAMEYVAGTTLKAWQVGRDWRAILAMYRRAGEGLQAAHAAGLVHRDFKPDNVLVGDDGRVRVTDFGLVASIDDGGPERAATPASLRGEIDLAMSMTRTGTILGTPRYMAPEQHLGQPVDARADQFAFCVALHEAWFGQPPFAGDDYEAMVSRVLAGDLRPVPAGSEVPPALCAAVARGLRRQREDRFASMTELLAALVDPTEAARAVPPPRRRWPWLVAAGAVVALAALAVGLFEARDAASSARRARAQLAADKEHLEVALADATSARDQAREALKAAAVDSIAAAGASTPAPSTPRPPAPAAGTTPPAERPWARGVSDDEQKAAQAPFHQGNRLLADGNHAAAVAAYREALTHWSHPAIHYNLALALVNLDDPLAARRALEKAIEYGAAPIDADKLQRALELIRLVDALIAEITCVDVPRGVTLLLDARDVFVGPGTYRERALAGAHTLAVKAGGVTSPARTLLFAAGSRRTLTMAEIVGD